jgi:hypothetical protein
MTKKQTKKIKHPPLWIALFLIFSFIGGIITATIGIFRIENYYRPYYFGFIFGGLGLLVGIVTAIKAKPFIAVNYSIRNDYFSVITHISVGFIGLFLLTGTYLNENLSHFNRRDNFEVINKYRREKRFRVSEKNTLIVNLNGKPFRIVCRHNYWDNVNIGQKIELCFYKSSIGFDYIVIENGK